MTCSKTDLRQAQAIGLPFCYPSANLFRCSSNSSLCFSRKGINAYCFFIQPFFKFAMIQITSGKLTKIEIFHFMSPFLMPH